MMKTPSLTTFLSGSSERSSQLVCPSVSILPEPRVSTSPAESFPTSDVGYLIAVNIGSSSSSYLWCVQPAFNKTLPSLMSPPRNFPPTDPLALLLALYVHLFLLYIQLSKIYLPIEIIITHIAKFLSSVFLYILTSIRIFLNNKLVYPAKQWNITHWWKEINYQAMQRHRGTLNACYWVKGTHLRRLHTVEIQK